jgi:hypothetical protein
MWYNDAGVRAPHKKKGSQPLRKIAFMSIYLLTFCGCAKLAHLQELLTLQDLSNNQARQEEYVKKHDEKFKDLLEAVETGSLSQYTHQKSFLRTFGEPILSKEIVKDGQVVERWLYRYSTKPFDSDKVYIYFDQGGRLVTWEVIQAVKERKAHEPNQPFDKLRVDTERPAKGGLSKYQDPKT